jgi:transposase
VDGTRRSASKISNAIKALLVSRALLVKIKRDIENQIRGLLKNIGLVIGRAKMNVFAVRAAELAEARPAVAAGVEPLLKALTRLSDDRLRTSTASCCG